jgi:hypothetical protein
VPPPGTVTVTTTWSPSFSPDVISVLVPSDSPTTTGVDTC